MHVVMHENTHTEKQKHICMHLPEANGPVLMQVI